MTRPTFALAATALLLAACQGMRVRPHGADPSRSGGTSFGGTSPVGPLDPAAPGGTGGGRTRVSDPATAAAGHTSGEQRRVCRAGSPPRGWIAVAYVADGGDCPLRRGRDTVYTAAVVTHYTNLPPGSLLDVCADQGVPAGWVRDDMQPENVGESCPGAARNGGSATYRIRRQR